MDKQELSIADSERDDLAHFRVIHPFHPFFGQQFSPTASREGLPEDRLYFIDPQGNPASIPLRFTDWAPMDPVMVLGQGRCPFRMADLLMLVELIENWRA